jgi:membrane protease YdiL (CAAX protease family)
MANAPAPMSTSIKKPFFKGDPTTTILATLGVFFISQIFAAILVGLYPAVQDWTDTEATAWLTNSIAGQFFYVLFAEIFAIAFVFQLLKIAKVTKAHIGLIKPRLKDFGYALITYGLYFVTYLAIILIARETVPSLNVDQEQQIGFESAYTGVQLFMTFMSLVILPPLAEEIMFRGFLFTSLRAKLRLRYAIILTSLLFGIAHLQFGADAPLLWVAGIDTFILSCFLCYLRERTGSLWPSIFLHAIKNSVAFMLLFGTRF